MLAERAALRPAQPQCRMSKPIPGFPDFEVTNQGGIRSRQSRIDDFQRMLDHHARRGTFDELDVPVGSPIAAFDTEPLADVLRRLDEAGDAGILVIRRSGPRRAGHRQTILQRVRIAPAMPVIPEGNEYS